MVDIIIQWVIGVAVLLVFFTIPVLLLIEVAGGIVEAITSNRSVRRQCQEESEKRDIRIKKLEATALRPVSPDWMDATNPWEAQRVHNELAKMKSKEKK